MSTDGFLLLQQPRRPWLDPDALKARFLELSTPLHPDRFHQAPDCEREDATRRYAELNAAYNQLREPRDRLLHLLELETGGRPKDIQRIPPGTMDLFVEVGQTCRDVDAFMAERARITSPLARVQYFKTSLEWVERLNRLQQTILTTRDAILEELRSLNSAWEKADGLPAESRAAALPLERIEQLYRAASYVHRWTDQIQQRAVDLAAA